MILFIDTDLPYLNAAQKDADITYLLEITPRFLKGPAFNIDKIYGKTGIFKAVEAYPQFEKLAGLIVRKAPLAVKGVLDKFAFAVFYHASWI